MIDLVIRGGQVVTPWGVGQWDVAIEGSRIVAVAEQGALPSDVGRVLDATGKVVAPGGVEPHAHVAAPVMGMPGQETAPPEQVSRASLFGGTTTLLDFAIVRPGSSIQSAIAERDTRWRGNSYSDYGYHIMLLPDIDAQVINPQVREAVQAGYPSFKIFTTDIRPAHLTEARRVGMGHLSSLMEQVQDSGGMLLVHSEDDDMVQYMYKKLTDEERTEWWNMHEVHSNMSEDVSFRRVLRVAEWTGCPVYFVHVSARQGVTAVQEARGRGMPVYAETLHNYVTWNAESYKEPDGMKYHTYPSLKSEQDRLALWDGLLQGHINSMATDEYCTSWAHKIQGRNLLDVTGGHNGAETRVGITYSEGVSKRGMSLQRFVEVTSANAARIMGLYPRKGAIAPGSDADVILIDPSIEKRLDKSDFHISDYSIWEDFPIQGWPVTTILRGKVVVENGQLLGTQGDGQYISRKVDARVVDRPVV